MTDQSVKNLASIFNQSIQSPGGMGRPVVSPKPGVAAKPPTTSKPGKLDLPNSTQIIGASLRSPSNGSHNKTPTHKVSPTHKAALPLGGALLGPNPKDILNIKNHLKKPPMPRPPISSTASEGSKVDFKRSLRKAPIAVPPPKIGGSQKPIEEEENTDPKENISTSKSDGDSSSLSSFTSDSSISRRGSSGRGSSGASPWNGSKKPRLEPLPPLDVLGAPPAKPAKPPSVKLPKSAAPPPVKRKKPSVTAPPEEEAGELYDDVDLDTARGANKRYSLIPTMDSDEEEIAEDLLYDDTEVIAAPTIPDIPVPPLPSVEHIPTVQVKQASVSDDIPQEIYDDVSIDGDCEELYEALDVSTEDAQRRPSIESADSGEAAAKPPPILSPRKISSQKNKQEEKMRRELEKQELQKRKKEEELRKKREKEEKKKKEREEKEIKKKFNIRGDIQVVDNGTAIQDCGADTEKLDLICKKGEKLEIIRREGNPPGKWLARDTQGRYGFIETDFVAVDSGDCQETYDDVIPWDDSESEEVEEEQEIYEAFD
ncbi:uncharacterized protein [Asterias amurensis]|uniref:uncharacterized protein n=1 Tax=Asterias amurensis TaxID=7602 RepID=UPI003AB6E314